MGRADLISDEYREMQHVLDKDPAYGVASLHYAPLVAKIIESVGATEPLDYGAGKGRLGVALQEALQRPLTVHHYEPAMPQWSVSPQPCRFVACLDVLEHIEPALLGTVLDDLMRVTAQVGVFSVDTGPAQKVLPDGRNAHLLQQPFEWWLPKLKARFDILSVNPMGGSFWVVVGRKRPWWQRLFAGLAGQRGP